jgi:DNA polymerase-3 subunit gamma/tau
LISFCGEKIEEADVLSMFGLAAEGQLLKLSNALLSGEIPAALSILDELAQGGKDLGRLLGDLLNHFRNLLIFQVSKGDLNLMEVSEAEVAALKEQAALSNTEALTRILEVFAEAELRLRDAASKKILVEVALLRAMEARNSIPIDAVLKQLNALRSGQGLGTAGSVPHAAATPSAPAPAPRPITKPKAAFVTPPVTAPIPPPAPVSVAIPVPVEPPVPFTPAAAEIPSIPPAPIASGNLADLWAGLIDAVGRVSPFTRGYLNYAHPVSFEKGLLTIGFDPEYEDHLGLVDTSRNHTLIQTKMAELGRSNSQVKFVKAEAPADWNRKLSEASPVAPVAAPAAPAATGTVDISPAGKSAAPVPEKKPAPVVLTKSDFKDDPLIKRALEVFRGQIVDVRG